MRKIAKSEILNNAYTKVADGVVTFHMPTKKQAEAMSYRDLCIVLCGTSALKFRSVDNATKNANYWLASNDRERLINLFY